MADGSRAKRSLGPVTGTTRSLLSKTIAKCRRPWRELEWDNGHHAEFIAPPVISSLLLSDGISVSQHQSLEQTVTSIKKISTGDGEAWRETHHRYYQLIRDYLIPYYYQAPQSGQGDSAKARFRTGG
jgi:phytoene dehydrogenase-like protein